MKTITKNYQSQFIALKGRNCVVVTQPQKFDVPIGTEVFVPEDTAIQYNSDYITVLKGSPDGKPIRVNVSSLILKVDYKLLKKIYGERISFSSTQSQSSLGGMPGKLQLKIVSG